MLLNTKKNLVSGKIFLPREREKSTGKRSKKREKPTFSRTGKALRFCGGAKRIRAVMILAPLKDSARYESLNPYFKKLFDYVKTHDLTAVPAGRIVIDGDNAFINVVDAPVKTQESAKLESHQKFLDVHVPLSGPETLGWLPRGEIPETPYDEAGDCQVYDGPAKVYTTIQPGEFVVYWPEDIHAPAITAAPLRKLIMKARC